MNQAKTAILEKSNDQNDAYSTHPKRSRRDSAIEVGFKNAIQTSYQPNNEQTNAEEFLNQGIALYQVRKYDESITKFNKAIELNSEMSMAFHFRGLSNKGLDRFDESLDDFK